jgi:hypothetical protein
MGTTYSVFVEEQTTKSEWKLISFAPAPPEKRYGNPAVFYSLDYQSQIQAFIQGPFFDAAFNLQTWKDTDRLSPGLRRYIEEDLNGYRNCDFIPDGYFFLSDFDEVDFSQLAKVFEPDDPGELEGDDYLERYRGKTYRELVSDDFLSEVQLLRRDHRSSNMRFLLFANN